MEMLRRTATSVIAVAVAVILATLAYLFSPAISGPGGIAIIVVMWIPLVIGAITLGAYFVVRYFTKDYAWIVTAIGVTFLLVSAVNALLAEPGGM